jgi:hypothetical protein
MLLRVSQAVTHLNGPVGAMGSNRDKAKEPRGRKFWCGCDRAMVSAGQKCPQCGKRNGKPRDRKPTPVSE